MALCSSLGKATSWCDAADGALDRGGEGPRLPSPLTTHAACAAPAHWYANACTVDII